MFQQYFQKSQKKKRRNLIKIDKNKVKQENIFENIPDYYKCVVDLRLNQNLKQKQIKNL